ncbi:MAG: hypothetical protein KatS3mg010_1802 [Acidimicrobiia bacterium]|nr:MAG: hypothetical protein KatS3mg010_1802 [Acidimicrobiia bacterium]
MPAITSFDVVALAGESDERVEREVGSLHVVQVVDEADPVAGAARFGLDRVQRGHVDPRVDEVDAPTEARRERGDDAVARAEHGIVVAQHDAELERRGRAHVGGLVEDAPPGTAPRQRRQRGEVDRRLAQVVDARDDERRVGCEPSNLAGGSNRERPVDPVH